jgi:integrase
MSRGSIQRRGRHSWRIKVDLASTNSGRQTRYLTVRGTRRDAERELARLVNAAHDGSLVEPSKLTVGAYLQAWLANPHGLANKTVTRYRQLAHYQIIPHLGMVPLQQLRPAHIVDWHAKLLAGGGVGGRALSARSVLHAHCLLHHALERALRSEIITRNVAHAVRPPRIETREIQILKADEIAAVLTALVDHPLYPLVVVALSSGARRGELLGLQWGDVDFASGTIKIERSLEQAGGTLQCKRPKSRHGVRTIALPAAAVEALKDHHRKTLERRLLLGQGKPAADTFVFTTFDGDPIRPDSLSRWWGDMVRSRKLPAVSFHALRHSHASALIAAGVDPLSASRRLGHSSPGITLNVYSHVFNRNEDKAVAAITAALKGAD